MTLTSDIVTRAARKIGVVASDEAMTADEIANGVIALNMMMHAWKLRGVDVEHVDLAATDTFSLDPEFEEGTVYLLASRMSPDYEIPPAFDADDWFRTIQAAYAPARVMTIPRLLLTLPTGRNRRFF